VSFDVIYHKKIEGKPKRVAKEEVNFNLAQLNTLLAEGYAALNDQYAVDTYQAYYKNYYQIAAGDSGGLKSRIKCIIKMLLGIQKNQEQSNSLLLLHNIRIDSHRFTVQRALSLKYER
jgi:hypothetical protein